MSSTLVKQWVELGQASLSALKEMTELNAASLGNAMQQPFDRSDAATMLKALLDYNKQLGDMYGTMVAGLLHNQLKLLEIGDSKTVIQDLTSTGTDFVNSFVQKQMAMATDFTTLFSGYLSGLQGASNLEDIALLQGQFFNNVEQKLKDDANGLGQLLMSAKTASVGIAERALQRAIDGQPQATASD